MTEGREWLERLLALTTGGALACTGVHGKALSAAGILACWLGDLNTARTLYEERLAVARKLADPLHITPWNR